MKKKTATVLLISIFVLSCLMVSGCSLITDKIGEKATEKAVESAMEQSGAKDAKVDINKGEMEFKTDQGTMKVGGTYEWPSTIPSDVPKFGSGKITMTSESSTADGKAMMVYYEGVDAAAGDTYKAALEQAGWKITTVNKTADGSYMLLAEKDKRNVNLVLAADSSNKGIGGWVAYNENK